MAEEADGLRDMVFYGLLGELHSAGYFLDGLMFIAAEFEDDPGFFGETAEGIVDDLTELLLIEILFGRSDVSGGIILPEEFLLQLAASMKVDDEIIEGGSEKGAPMANVEVVASGPDLFEKGLNEFFGIMSGAGLAAGDTI